MVIFLYYWIKFWIVQIVATRGIIIWNRYRISLQNISSTRSEINNSACLYRKQSRLMEIWKSWAWVVYLILTVVDQGLYCITYKIKTHCFGLRHLEYMNDIKKYFWYDFRTVKVTCPEYIVMTIFSQIGWRISFDSKI